MRILSWDDLRTLKGIRYSKATIYRKIKNGTFPRQVHMGENCVGFVETEIDRLIADRIAERDSDNIGAIYDCSEERIAALKAKQAEKAT